jgi:superoxide reductase
MKNRRNFIKTSAVAVAAVALTGKAIAGNDKNTIKIEDLPGLIYTEKNQGQWQNKAGSHLPKVTVKGNKVSLVTPHGMSEQHYIVRHTLVDQNGNVIGAKTFSPSDEPKSEFELPNDFKGTLYATSFCNKHDFWVKKFKV